MFLQFRLCKFTVKGNKAVYLCQDDCVAKFRWKSDQCSFGKKCEQCLSVISEKEDKSYCWQLKHFCSNICLSK